MGGGNLYRTPQVLFCIRTPLLKKVIIGSHIDTVTAGGRFDGIAGVIAGLECVHYLNQNHINLPFDLEIIDFLGEELNVWGTSCIGSRYMAGLLTDDLLKRVDADGRACSGMRLKNGGTGQPSLSPRDDADTIMACFELHIEQSDLLEKSTVDIGIVTISQESADIQLLLRVLPATVGQYECMNGKMRWSQQVRSPAWSRIWQQE